MASIGRLTKLKKDNVVVAGLRVLNISWSSESIDLSRGESDGFRRLAEIDGLESISISVEGLTKEAFFQELAYTRNDSRLLTNCTIDIPDENGQPYKTLSTDFYFDNYSQTAEIKGAIAFTCNLISSARIENGQIIGVTIDPQTGEITGTPGRSYIDTV